MVARSVLGILRFLIACCFLSSVLGLAVAQNASSDSSLTSNPVYEKNCAKCHGKTAGGHAFAGPALDNAKTAAASAGDLRNFITNGKGRMPKFAGKLSTEEIDTLVQQIQALSKK